MCVPVCVCVLCVCVHVCTFVCGGCIVEESVEIKVVCGLILKSDELWLECRSQHSTLLSS